MSENKDNRHVVPVDRPHQASVDCWCEPCVDEGVSHPSGARVWIHHDEVERLRHGIRDCAATLVKWAVAFGGSTPMAIVASNLRRLVGDEPPLPEVVPCDKHGNEIK